MSAGATSGAAAAAAAAAQRLRQEEEEMTAYTPRELAEDWEFKILRSNFNTFRNPEKLRAVLEEEKRGGWVLVEKFDDQRIRLKRAAGTKVTQGDFADGYEPYRTTIGVSQGFLVLAILGVLGILFASILLAGVLSHA
jgi:hypothetical protein